MRITHSVTSRDSGAIIVMPYTALVCWGYQLHLPSASNLLARVGGTVNYLILVDACNAVYISRLVLTTCLLSLVELRHLEG